MDFIDPSRIEYSDAQKLGEGRFGVVVAGRLRRPASDGVECWRPVAIKQLIPSSPSSSVIERTPIGTAPSEQFMKEIVRTVEISKQVPNIVECYGWSTLPLGLCLVMKLCTGTLAALIAEQLDDKLSFKRILQLGRDILRGLAGLHGKRILFMDLKPGNILMEEDGRAVLADFGLSRSMQASMIMTGLLAGTYFYMAPEKLRRRQHGEQLRLTLAADIWSFGITMIQLMTPDLNAPYGPGVDVPNIMYQLLVDKEAPTVPATPECPRLQALIQPCLELDPTKRPSAAALLMGFEGIMASTDSSATFGRPIVDLKAEANKAEAAKAQAEAAKAQAEAAKAQAQAEAAKAQAQAEAAKAQAEAESLRMQLELAKLQGEAKRQEAQAAAQKTTPALAALEKYTKLAQADEDKPTPLCRAAKEGDLVAVQHILMLGASVHEADKYGNTPLIYASQEGHADVAKTLLDRGAPVDKADKYGETPLIYASQEGHADVAKTLLDRGASVDKANENGWTPLIHASMYGHAAVAKTLLDRGASVDKADKWGRTPLIYASQEGHAHVVKTLLDRGASVDKANEDGDTPLIYASQNGHAHVAKTLLDRGASVDKANEDGKIPLQFAKDIGHQQVVDLLLRQGARR